MNPRVHLNSNLSACRAISVTLQMIKEDESNVEAYAIRGRDHTYKFSTANSIVHCLHLKSMFCLLTNDVVFRNSAGIQLRN